MHLERSSSTPVDPPVRTCLFAHRRLLKRVIVGLFGFAAIPLPVLAQSAPAAAVASLELGAENQLIAQRAGLWDVTETVWERPGAAPVTTTGLIAERRMIGSMFQEILRPASAPPGTGILRIDYLHFDRLEGRWDYVSMDMRAPVPIMPAWSFERGENASIDVIFAPFAGPGAGQMLRMRETITYAEPDRDVKDQFFLMADGTGTKWLAHRYAYKRRK